MLARVAARWIAAGAEVANFTAPLPHSPWLVCENVTSLRVPPPPPYLPPSLANSSTATCSSVGNLTPLCELKRGSWIRAPQSYMLPQSYILMVCILTFKINVIFMYYTAKKLQKGVCRFYFFSYNNLVISTHVFEQFWVGICKYIKNIDSDLTLI